MAVPTCPRRVNPIMVKIVKKTDLYPIGADDDGSGTMTIFEAYRGLISAGFLPKRTVEFHFYSAEVWVL